MKTRVSAKYIRKLCKEYQIPITEHLRSKKVKAKYVAKIAEAIIEETIKEEIKDRNQEIHKALNNLPENLMVYPYNPDWVMRKIELKHRRIGSIGFISYTDENIFYQYSKCGFPRLYDGSIEGLVETLLNAAAYRVAF